MTVNSGGLLIKSPGFLKRLVIRVARFFVVQTYQNGKDVPNDHTLIPNGHKLYQMAVKYSKWSKNIPRLSIPRPFKIYPNWNFGFENKPSGKPACDICIFSKGCTYVYTSICPSKPRIPRKFLFPDYSGPLRGSSS
jgi:hypothetical protein